MKRLFLYLLSLNRQKFWGDITIKFKNGEFAGHVVANQTLKEEALPLLTPESEKELHRVLNGL